MLLVECTFVDKDLVVYHLYCVVTQMPCLHLLTNKYVDAGFMYCLKGPPVNHCSFKANFLNFCFFSR